MPTPIGLPRPLPDELLYSVFARSARYIGQWSPKGLAAALYGHRAVLACPDLPCSMALLTELSRDAWGMTVTELALRHTMAGYYTHFLGQAGRQEMLAAMLGRAAHLHQRLGICAGTVQRLATFRLCPACVEDDLRLLGETYWRRAHHLPGALICARHAVSLVDSTVPFRPLGRHEHVAASAAMLAAGGAHLCPSSWESIALGLARDSAALLDAAPEEPGTWDYGEMLGLRGYRNSHGGLQRLKEDAQALLGNQLVQLFFKQHCDDGDALDWLAEPLRACRRALAPFKHVLLRRLLESVSQRPQTARRQTCKTWGVYKSPALRTQALSLNAQGLSTNAIARALRVDWKTAQRLLNPVALTSARPQATLLTDQHRWNELRRCRPTYSRTELRRAAPALYARLYRAAQPWLLRQMPARCRCATTRERVDWSARDQSLATRIQVNIQNILQRSPLVRVSVSRVLGELGQRSLLAHYAHKLPSSRAVLTRGCETAHDFQIRRLCTVLRAEPMGKKTPDSSLLRLARINPDRLADRGAMLLMQARQNVAHENGRTKSP